MDTKARQQTCRETDCHHSLAAHPVGLQSVEDVDSGLRKPKKKKKKKPKQKFKDRRKAQRPATHHAIAADYHQRRATHTSEGLCAKTGQGGIRMNVGIVNGPSVVIAFLHTVGEGLE
jgi:hypothetical protein